MKKIILLAALACAGFNTLHAQSPKKEMPVLRHVVLFKFLDKATPADIKKIEESFRALPVKIKLIKDFEWGTNNSPENLNQGLTHCFFVSFASEKDRDDYLVHPSHKDFVSIAGPFIDKVTVVDYWVQK
ncbi:MAG: Dabb family protein [Bacteroidota bacterium]